MDRELVGWNRPLHPEVHGMPRISHTKGWGKTRQCARRSSWSGSHSTGREHLRKQTALKGRCSARDCRGGSTIKGRGQGRHHTTEVGRRGCRFTGSFSGKLGGLPQVMLQEPSQDQERPKSCPCGRLSTCSISTLVSGSTTQAPCWEISWMSLLRFCDCACC